MPETNIIVKNLKIKQRATFDMGELYKVMFRWFSRNNYDFQEKEYLEKAMGDGSAKQLEIAWRARKKISDYFRFDIKVKFLIIGLKSTEIEVGDVKRKTNEGDLEMRFDAVIVSDYEGKYEGNPVTKFFKDIYNHYIIKSRIENYETQIHEEVYELLAEIKSFLNLFKFQEVKAEE
ncbi:MAG: hypothetical protein CMH64_00695 [Nanoarchaeota archaeon]|nr:hypothetical protein [Nanoarchaeota archaeon]|tara:strand:+ start:1958 stop:2485 length:528 start_codon:yes stop_codon:yes gene_type:complete